MTKIASNGLFDGRQINSWHREIRKVVAGHVQNVQYDDRHIENDTETQNTQKALVKQLQKISIVIAKYILCFLHLKHILQHSEFNREQLLQLVAPVTPRFGTWQI